jgi:hypothetical protein
MTIEQIIPELKKLSHSDKLMAMQVLVMELVAEESQILAPNMTYEIFTPLGNEDAVQTLYEFLQNSKHGDN